MLAHYHGQTWNRSELARSLGLYRRALFGSPRVGASWEGFAIEQVLAAVRPSEAYFWATYGQARISACPIAEIQGLAEEVQRKSRAPRPRSPRATKS